ncbi:hypothetical protein L873DRAFT_1650490, partial [Choiromyces venosus 120613-1]
MLAFNQGARITQMFHNFMKEQLELRLEFAQIQEELIQIQDQQQRFPEMLYNADASHLEPLRYQAGIPINNLPATRRELEPFTG